MGHAGTNFCEDTDYGSDVRAVCPVSCGICEAQDADLAARLHLLGVRTVADQTDMPASAVKTALLACHPEARRFVARAVVRTLLRRYVKTYLVAFYWMEQSTQRRYAAPDAAGFEADMAAPLFTEGALGA